MLGKTGYNQARPKTLKQFVKLKGEALAADFEKFGLSWEFTKKNKA